MPFVRKIEFGSHVWAPAMTKERLAGDRFREITGFIAYFWLAQERRKQKFLQTCHHKAGS